MVWEDTKNNTHNVLKSSTNSTDKINKNDYEYKYIYFVNLIWIVLIVMLQLVIFYIVQKINEPEQVSNAGASSQNEEGIPSQPVAHANENLELKQDPGEGPSLVQLQPSQNVATYRTRRTLKESDLYREDVDRENFEPLAEACHPMDFEELRADSLQPEESPNKLSIAENLDRENFEPVAEACHPLAFEELRADSLQPEESPKNLPTLSASSHKGDSLQSKSGVDTLPD